MSNLRKQLIRIANDHPETREHLVPLLKTSGHAVDIKAHFKGARIDEMDIDYWWTDFNKHTAFMIEVDKLHGVHNPAVMNLKMDVEAQSYNKKQFVIPDAGEVTQVVLDERYMRNKLGKDPVVSMENVGVRFDMGDAKARRSDEDLEPRGRAELKAEVIYKVGEKEEMRKVHISRIPCEITMAVSQDYEEKLSDYLFNY